MSDELIERLRISLPRQPGVHDKGQYFNSAVMALLLRGDRELHFLFEKRAKGVKQEGEVCFPGGRCEPTLDRDELATAIREIHEELGLSGDQIDVVGRLDTIVAPMGATVDAFVGTASIDAVHRLKIDAAEVQEVFTVPVNFFLAHPPRLFDVIVRIHPSYVDEHGKEVVLFPAQQLGLPERYRSPWGNSRVKVLVYEWGGHVIWGITARIVHDIVSRLRQDGSTPTPP